MSRAHRVRRLPVLILAGGLAVFLGLAISCRVLYHQSEERLLEQRTAEAASALQLTVTQVRAPLDAAAQVADVTNGDPAAFETVMASSVGTGKTFTSAALYRIGSPEPIALVGAPMALDDDAAGPTAMLAKMSTEPFVIVDLLSGDARHLGYAVVDEADQPEYAVYGERTLSTDPNIRRRTDEPFSQLDYAIYLGSGQSNEHLLGASLRELPITGRHAAQTFDFGDTTIELVMTPIGHLSGDLFANLWWIVALIGAFVTLVIAALTQRILERRDTALDLAAENERLYGEQREIAETLQLSLLPQHLHATSGVTVAARYWPAGSANLIGGDFYDAFNLDDARCAIAIGDVCGKGIEAAALTGLARHTLRAAARDATSPRAVLQAVHLAMSDHEPPTFCTACFGFVTAWFDGRFVIELALGGHPQPVLRRSDGTVGPVGVPGTLLGLIDPQLTDAVLDVAVGDTLVLYTDGLTDAPAQQAVSVEEIVELLAAKGDEPIEQLADDIRAIKRSRRPLGSGDDTALLIVRFGEPSDVLDTDGHAVGEPLSVLGYDSEAEASARSSV